MLFARSRCGERAQRALDVQLLSHAKVESSPMSMASADGRSHVGPVAAEVRQVAPQGSGAHREAVSHEALADTARERAAMVRVWAMSSLLLQPLAVAHEVFYLEATSPGSLR